MSFNAEVIRVLIASPSDVQQERDEIEQAIFKWNNKYAEELQVILLPGRWENVAPTYRGSNPQEILNEKLVNNCDMVIGVFWTKLGSPTLNYASGTLEEINIFAEQGKEVMVYFVDRHIPMNIDFDEVKKVEEFKNDYRGKGIYSTYDVSKIDDHLYEKVTKYKKKVVKNSNEIINITGNVNTTQVLEENIIKKLILSKRLTINEMIMMGYLLDTGNRSLGTRWKIDETLIKIKMWEEKELIPGILSNNYETIITNLFDRGLINPKEYTDYNNVRLYEMPLNIYDQLSDLPQNLKNEIKSAILSQVELPF